MLHGAAPGADSRRSRCRAAIITGACPRKYSLCARKCPDQAIEMRDGRPVWVKERCIMCLGCLHRCPKFAIQYDDRTREHGQYRHPGTRV